jgi:mono/diheme cytochrome c family protein
MTDPIRLSRLLVAIGLAGATLVAAQEPVPAPARPAQGTPNIGPRAAQGPPDRPPVDPVAATRGQALYGAECITCHGSTARGTATAPSLIRSIVVLNDRYGTLLVPFFQKGHPMQSGKPSASLTKEQAVDLMHFLRQRINDTLRGSEAFNVKDIVTGDPKAGEAYFNGEGKCTACHSVAGDFAGLKSRIPAAVDVQQRMLFPSGRGGRGRGATPASAGPSRTAITVTVTPATGPAQTGTLIEEDDFHVTFRDAGGAVRVVRKTPGMKVTTVDPLQAHRDLLDRITDKNIHDVVAYLETLK